MKYVSLEKRICDECKDQAKEYLVKKGTRGLLGIFSALSDTSAKNMDLFLTSGIKSPSLDLLLCIIPLVLKNGKSFDTEKVVILIQNTYPKQSNDELFDCLVLFSYIFDLFYGTNLEDTIDNINSLSKECEKKLKISTIPKLEKSNISSKVLKYNSLIALNEYIESKDICDNFSYNYTNETTKAITFFIKGVTNENNKITNETEKKYGNTIKSFLLSI